MRNLKYVIQEDSLLLSYFGKRCRITLPKKLSKDEVLQLVISNMFQEAEAPSVLDIAWTEVPSTFEISLFQQHVNLVYEGKDLILSRQSWMDQKIDTKTIRIEEIKTLQIFIDCSAMEIFINQGERVLSLRYFLHQENRTCQCHSSHQMELTYSKIES